MLKYTLCLIKNGDQFLLLNRLKKPQMGTWNGVGGKIESGETPRESVIREIFEETGILLKELVYAGNVIFKSTEGRVGLEHLFTYDQGVILDNTTAELSGIDINEKSAPPFVVS